MEDRCKRIFIFFGSSFFVTDKMIMHPLRRGGKGAASGKQFTSNVLVGYWLFVRLAVCVPTRLVRICVELYPSTF